MSSDARDAAVQQSSRNNAEKQKQIEKEIEERALKTAQERMELELLAMKEQLKRKEEERIRLEKEELKKREVERQREEAFSKWQENVAKEQQQQEQKTANDAQMTEQEQSNSAIKDSDNTDLQQDHHPILGPKIAHLPYKRVHLTSASKLASLPVYEKQRAYRHDRAKEMAKDKKKTLWMGIPGVISLMEEECGRLSILDGQHRVGMMALLSEEQRKIVEKNQNVNGANGEQSTNEGKDNPLAQLDLENILVEVFLPQQKSNNTDSVLNDSKKQQPTAEEQDDKAIIFTEINKAEPIKLLDLPGVTNKKTRDVIDYAANHFYNAFPEMFSPSQKCRAPHLNLDNLRDALFASEVIKREKVGSGGELVKWMGKKNDELREMYTSGDGVDGGGKKVSQNALKKAKNHDFYLGLESTWLYK